MAAPCQLHHAEQQHPPTSSPRFAPSNVPPCPGPASEPYSAFSKRQRIFLIFVASLSATFSGFASNIYFPAIPTIAQALDTSVTNINLTVASYMVFQAITPTFWGALSDVYGRRITLICTFTIFLGACIGLALTRHFYELIILRCLQSTGSASTIAIGAGIIGDVTTREERGGIMGIFQTGLLFPLAIGPVLGGVFAQTLGWRAIFWFLVIYAALFVVLLVIFVPETLRSLVGNGIIPPPGISKAPLDYLTAPSRARVTSKPTEEASSKVHLDFFGPIRILFLPEVFITLFFLSIHYATWQMTLTAQSSLFASTYHISQLEIGLTFIANGFGCMLGALTTGKILDRDYARIKSTHPGHIPDFPIEKARLRTIWIWSPFQWFAVLLFGWTLDQRLHISAPIIASFILAWSAISAQSVITTYLVDIFPKKSASATAALNLARCLVGAGATASVEPTIQSIGVGWTFTLWTGFMVLSFSLVGVQMRYGGTWRRNREARAAGSDL